MLLTANERRIVILTMLGEAAGEGSKGLEAVGHVMVNRVASPSWPNSLAKVAKQKSTRGGKVIHQFSTWNSKALQGNSPELRYSPDGASWKKAEAALDKVLGGSYDFTEGADHYHTPAVNPKWNRKMAKTATIGNHLFFRSTKKPVDRSGVIAGGAQNLTTEALGQHDILYGQKPGKFVPGRFDPGYKSAVNSKPEGIIGLPPQRPTTISGEIVKDKWGIPSANVKANKKAFAEAERQYSQVEKAFAADGDLIKYMDATTEIGKQTQITRMSIRDETNRARETLKTTKSRRNEQRAEDALSVSEGGYKRPQDQPKETVADTLGRFGAKTNPVTGEVIPWSTPVSPKEQADLSPVVKQYYPEIEAGVQVAPVVEDKIAPRSPGRPAQATNDPIDQEFRSEFGDDAILNRSGYAYKLVKDDTDPRGFKSISLGRANNRIREAKGIAADPRGDRQAGLRKGSFLERLFGKKE